MHKKTNVKINNSRVYLDIFIAFDVQNSCKQTKNVDRLTESQGRLSNFKGCLGEIHSLAGSKSCVTFLRGGSWNWAPSWVTWAVGNSAPTVHRLAGLHWQTEGRGEPPAQCSWSSHQSTVPPVITQAFIELIKTWAVLKKWSTEGSSWVVKPSSRISLDTDQLRKSDWRVKRGKMRLDYF